MSDRKFVIDANVLIEAHQRYYAFDIAPSFWNRLIEHAKAGRIVSIDQVKEELTRGNEEDLLHNWSKNSFSEWFETTQDQAIYENYSKIITWVQQNDQYYDSAKSEFASIADSWLIAYAHSKDYTIVTHEEFKEHARKRVLIPNVCQAFGVPYMNTFEMLRSLGTIIG